MDSLSEGRGTGTRRLTEREVQEVLEIASDIEARAGTGGLTVAELQQVAAEVGIPSEALSGALREVARTTTGPGISVRSSLDQRETRFISGRVSDDDLSWMLRLLEQLGQIEGPVTFEAGALTWETPTALRVALVNRSTETSVTVETNDQRHMVFASAAFMAAGATVGLLLSNVGGGDPNVGYAITGAGAGGLGAVLYWRDRVVRLRERVVKVASGISEVVRMIARRSGED